MMFLEQASFKKPILNGSNGRVIISLKLLVNYTLYWIYLLNVIFIPYDNFGLKKISFILLILFNFDKVLSTSKKGREKNIVLLFGFVLPVYTILKSFLLTGDIIGNIFYGYTGTILLLYYIIKSDQIDFISMMVKVLLLLAVFIDLCALLDLMGIIPIFQNPILMWMYETENANIGKSSMFLLGYYLFIKTTPMMLLSLGYYAWKKRFIICFLILLALALSGTRANAILAIITFGIAIIISETNSTKRIIVIIAVVVSISFILFGQGLLSKYIVYSAGKDSSDLVRTNTLSSIIKTWRDNPLTLFTGQGYASTFYNSGRMVATSDVELSYWNLLRRVGIFSFIAMMTGYFYPVKKLFKDKRSFPVCIGYIAYMVGAYVNPLLYTSTGVTVLLFMYVLSFCGHNQHVT